MLERLSFRTHPQHAILVRRAYHNEEPGWHAFCISHCRCTFHDQSPFVAYALMFDHIDKGNGAHHYASAQVGN